MRRVILVAIGGYLLIAAANKVVEAAGAMTCDCAEDCWCRQEGLSLFRWVFPWRHRGAHSATEKARLNTAAR